MKFLYTLILLIFISITPVLAKDTVQTKDTILTGKIFSYVDGLIKINKSGMEYTFTRSKNIDYFGDFIQYKEKPLARKLTDANCRVIYIDLYKVVFEIPSARIQVPRYRVKNIVLNAD